MNGMKIENAIKILEPYKKSVFGDASEKYGGSISVEEIIELLKEQEAVMPRVSTVEQRCGNCNKVIEMDGWKACPWCGKPIAWNEWWNKNNGQEVEQNA